MASKNDACIQNGSIYTLYPIMEKVHNNTSIFIDKII